VVPRATFRASASLGNDCRLLSGTPARQQSRQLTSVKDAGQVQFRKASREFGERIKRSPPHGAVRVAHTLASISCMRAT
jgi:hypothetical protein